jgi:hypothetical protein
MPCARGGVYQSRTCARDASAGMHCLDDLAHVAIPCYQIVSLFPFWMGLFGGGVCARFHVTGVDGW